MQRIPSELRFCQVGLTICLALSLAGLMAERATADPARFWISASNVATAGPEAPTIKGINGGDGFLHIWAQPKTDGIGPYHAVTNPFESLRNFSLNLVRKAANPDQAIVDFKDSSGSIVVHNPALTAMADRYQVDYDSDSLPPLVSDKTVVQVIAGAFDGIHSMQGFTITNGEGLGFGPTCNPVVDNCAITSNGSPAWLIASVKFRTVLAAGSIKYYLQIGNNGMNHFDSIGNSEPSSQTTVRFGSGVTPDYLASTQRNLTLAGDDPDVIINAFAPPAGDYNRNGVVDAADYTVWRNTKGSVGANLPADGDGNGSVGDSDYSYWKLRFNNMAGSGAGGGSPAGAAVPEPAAILLALAAMLAKRCRQRRKRHALGRTRSGRGS